MRMSTTVRDMARTFGPGAVIVKLIILILESFSLMDLFSLRVFLAVAEERSFSRAASRLYRTQSAVSQSIRRLEEELKETLVDRSTREGRLTEAGRVLKEHAERLVRLADEAAAAVREVRDLERGVVTIGSNEAAVEVLLPLIARFRQAHPGVVVDVRRVPSREIAAAVLAGSLDFGVLTFAPGEKGLASVVIGADELVVLAPPNHPFARKRHLSMAEFGRACVIAHNDPSPARERVLRRFEETRTPLGIRISLPSLAGVLRAVERGMGVALLPRRCALAEVERKSLVAIPMIGLRLPRDVRLVYRRAGHASRSATAFREVTTRKA